MGGSARCCWNSSSWSGGAGRWPPRGRRWGVPPSPRTALIRGVHIGGEGGADAPSPLVDGRRDLRSCHRLHVGLSRYRSWGGRRSPSRRVRASLPSTGPAQSGAGWRGTVGEVPHGRCGKAGEGAVILRASSLPPENARRTRRAGRRPEMPRPKLRSWPGSEDGGTVVLALMAGSGPYLLASRMLGRS